MNYMNEKQYMLYKYSLLDIDIDNQNTAAAINIQWYNTVSCLNPHTCNNCNKDLIIYNNLLIEKNKNELDIFDTSESKIRKCCNHCFWYEYFKSRRVQH